MKSTDKFLTGIVIGAILLAVIAFGVTLLRPDAEYMHGDGPEDIAHNYLLALNNRDYDRAYGYLSPTLVNYPSDWVNFKNDIEIYTGRFREGDSANLSILNSDIDGTYATVEVRETRYYNRDLFSSGQSSHEFEINMEMEAGEWKIYNAGNYFVWCWNELNGCRP